MLAHGMGWTPDALTREPRRQTWPPFPQVEVTASSRDAPRAPCRKGGRRVCLCMCVHAGSIFLCSLLAFSPEPC